MSATATPSPRPSPYFFSTLCLILLPARAAHAEDVIRPFFVTLRPPQRGRHGLSSRLRRSGLQHGGRGTRLTTLCLKPFILKDNCFEREPLRKTASKWKTKMQLSEQGWPPGPRSRALTVPASRECFRLSLLSNLTPVAISTFLQEEWMQPSLALDWANDEYYRVDPRR